MEQNTGWNGKLLKDSDELLIGDYRLNENNKRDKCIKLCEFSHRHIETSESANIEHLIEEQNI